MALSMTAGASEPTFAFHATCLGAAARRALEPAGEGRVVAVFRRSFYLETAGGLACVGPEGLGPGPLNLLCRLPEGLDWGASGLRGGARTVVRRGHFRVQRLRFETAGAALWTPPPVPPGWTRAGLAQGLRLLAARAGDLAQDAGLGGLIPALVLAPPRPEAPPGPPWTAHARPAVLALADWLRESGRRAAPAGPPPVEALVGLGPGLTPSGDDFIGGALVALRTLGRVATADRLGRPALARARAGATGDISRAHLECAARGEAAAALHGALTALCRAEGEALGRALAGLDGLGHSSGWDMLAGAAAACAAVAGEA